MKLTVQPDKRLEDGKHKGVIVAVESRDKPYEYTDFVIEAEGVKLKTGFPSVLTPTSKIGRFFLRIGLEVTLGKEITDEQVIGKVVEFITMQKEKNGKHYCEIIAESVKLAQ